jgi:hypothetical protein
VGRFAGVSVAAVFAVDAAPAVATVVVAVAPAASVACVDDAVVDAAADWLAASAAAAMASGVVVPLVEAAVVGVAVIATVTGIATATGVAVTVVVPTGCVWTAEAVLESVAEPLPEAELWSVLSAFDEADFERDRGGASLLAALLASEDDAGGGLGLSELLLAGAAFDGWLLLSLEAELLSDERGGGADWLCGSICEGGNALLASAAALLSTRLANVSLACDEADADRENRDAGVGKDALAASDVTLCTDGLSG